MVLVLVQNVSCIFMELEGPRPATDVNLDERTSKVDGTCLGGVVNVLDSTDRRFGFNDGCWFREWPWDVGSEEGTIELYHEKEATKEDP